MYCMDQCLELKFCRKTKPADAVSAEAVEVAVMGAVTSLRRAVASTNASLDNCFVFTLENRNSLMRHIADVKEQVSRAGCGYLLELCSLAEIITLILFRSHSYRDHQGLEQIELAVQQMHVCCTTRRDSQSADNREQGKRLTETVESLWRWVDTNTRPGVYSI